jgi:5-methylthioadenosine/S-adenosylhomocysteine deaminase
VGGLTVTNCELDGQTVSIRSEDGLIAALGPDVAPAESDEVIDGSGFLLCAPFVNAHTHAAMTLFRGFGDDRPLMDWLENYIWPAEARLEPEDVYWGTRLAAAEMLRSGTTRFVDMYWHSGQVARAVRDTGIRAVVSSVLIDGMDPAKGETLRGNATGAIDELAEFGPLVTPAFGPHAIYTVSPQSLRWLAETAAERDLSLNIHLSETKGEVDDCLTAHGKRPAHHLDELGFLGPRTILAHGVWLDPSELELIAERGATVASNPGANMKLGVGGAFPYPGAAAAGVGLGLGTDGVSSNNSLDMLEEVKLFALLQKHTTADPSVLPAAEALAIARGQRSDLLGGAPLEPGRDADFILLRGDAIELTAGDLDAALAYAALGSIVDTAVVAGTVVMRGRAVPGMEEAAEQVKARTERLTGVSR